MRWRSPHNTRRFRDDLRGASSKYPARLLPDPVPLLCVEARVSVIADARIGRCLRVVAAAQNAEELLILDVESKQPLFECRHLGLRHSRVRVPINREGRRVVIEDRRLDFSDPGCRRRWHSEIVFWQLRGEKARAVEDSDAQQRAHPTLRPLAARIGDRDLDCYGIAR